MTEQRIAEAAQARANAGVAGIVEALQNERQGYVQRGLADRAAQVDAQLAHYGVDVVETADANVDGEGEQSPTNGEGEQSPTNGEGEQRRGSARSRVPAPSDVPQE